MTKSEQITLLRQALAHACKAMSELAGRPDGDYRGSPYYLDVLRCTKPKPEPVIQSIYRWNEMNSAPKTGEQILARDSQDFYLCRWKKVDIHEGWFLDDDQQIEPDEWTPMPKLTVED